MCVALVPFNGALGGYFNSIVDDKAWISETFKFHLCFLKGCLLYESTCMAFLCISVSCHR